MQQRKQLRVGQKAQMFNKVTREEIRAFAELTKDSNKIHMIRSLQKISGSRSQLRMGCFR